MSKEPREDARFFVWLKWSGKYSPQIWYGDQKKGTGQFQYGSVSEAGPLVAFHELAADDRRDLKELATDWSLMSEPQRFIAIGSCIVPVVAVPSEKIVGKPATGNWTEGFN